MMAQMKPMTAADLEARYGPMISLQELATFFRAHIRAIRNALDRQGIPIFTFGESVVVPLRAVEHGFGLEELAVDEDVLRHEAPRFESTYRPDGTRKPVEEFVAEMRADTATWMALVEAAREAARPNHLAVSR